MYHEIDNIQFAVMSTEDILKLSVAEISSSKLQGYNTVYDPRMGTLEFDDICVTCGQSGKNCVGHFGHINLQCRILNPLYIKVILSILKCICYKCSRLLLTEEKLYMNDILKKKGSNRFNTIIKYVDKIDICSHCNSSQPKFLYSTHDKNIYMNFKLKNINEKIILSDDEIYKILCNMTTKDVKCMGLHAAHICPKDLVFNVLPVLPPVSRPYVVAENLTCDDDLTLQYIEVLKCNQNIQKNENEIKKNKYIQMMKFRVRSLFDNSNDKQKVSNGRPLKGIKKRLSGKDGIIRNNLMGKRVDKSGRSVIGPDPKLKVNEIGIPHEIAENLCHSTKINQYNIQHFQELIEKEKVNYVLRNKSNQSFRINVKYGTINLISKLEFGDIIFRNKKYKMTIRKENDKFKIKNDDVVYRNGEKLDISHHRSKKFFELQIGDIVERHLMDNDVLLLNRQPTLHKGSMISQKIKVIPGKTIRLNLAVTTSFNADFDGDEMNIFAPNNVEAETELRNLSTVKNFIINPQNSSANIVIVQDTIIAIYKMTLSKNQTPIEKKSFMKILSSLDNLDIPAYQTKYNFFKKYCGRLLFSILLPSSFFYQKENNVDENEPTVVIKNGILISGGLCKKDINKIISLLYIEYGPNICEKYINNIQYLGNEFLLYHGFSIGIKDSMIQSKKEIEYCISKSLVKAKSIAESVKNEKIKEIYTRFSLIAARDLGLTIAKKLMREDNNFRDCVESGAKGQFFNIAQITGLLGQQEVLGERVKKTLNNETRTLPHYPCDDNLLTDEMRFESRGFIFSSFLEGLNPREFFFHSLVGREGITDTSMKTSTSGYIQRRMVKILEDIFVSYDGTIRKANTNQIIQYVYGNNHLNPSNCIIHDNELFPLDIQRLALNINSEVDTIS